MNFNFFIKHPKEFALCFPEFRGTIYHYESFSIFSNEFVALMHNPQVTGAWIYPKTTLEMFKEFGQPKRISYKQKASNLWPIVPALHKGFPSVQLPLGV